MQTMENMQNMQNMKNMQNMQDMQNMQNMQNIKNMQNMQDMQNMQNKQNISPLFFSRRKTKNLRSLNQYQLADLSRPFGLVYTAHVSYYSSDRNFACHPQLQSTTAVTIIFIQYVVQLILIAVEMRVFFGTSCISILCLVSDY